MHIMKKIMQMKFEFGLGGLGQQSLNGCYQVCKIVFDSTKVKSLIKTFYILWSPDSMYSYIGL